MLGKTLIPFSYQCVHNCFAGHRGVRITQVEPLLPDECERACFSQLTYESAPNPESHSALSGPSTPVFNAVVVGCEAVPNAP
jgi:hypothetical protein